MRLRQIVAYELNGILHGIMHRKVHLFLIKGNTLLHLLTINGIICFKYTEFTRSFMHVQHVNAGLNQDLRFFTNLFFFVAKFFLKK
jgi:hypothetical protein